MRSRAEDAVPEIERLKRLSHEGGMDKQVLMLVKSDPEASHRAVEALRIALGLISGEHQVQVVLMEKAPLLLGEDAEDLVDGEELGKYLPTLKELDMNFLVEEEALRRAGLDDCEFKVTPVTLQAISDLIPRFERHIVF